MSFVLKTTYLIMLACAELCCADSPDTPTFAEPCCADLPDSPTFAKPCCRDSPDSLTLAEPCCADSPGSPTLAKSCFREKCDSPRQIRTSNERVSQIWREWPLLNTKSTITDWAKLKKLILHFRCSMHVG
jgi:hypothetical protein